MPEKFKEPEAVWDLSEGEPYPRYALVIRGPVPDGFSSYDRYLLTVKCLGPHGKRRVHKRAVWAWGPGNHVVEGTDAEQAKVDAVRDAHRLMSFDLKNMERQVTILKFRVAMLATQLTPEEP